jgi:hypothetical protein
MVADPVMSEMMRGIAYQNEQVVAAVRQGDVLGPTILSDAGICRRFHLG